ncbi:hypothetical protein IYN88_13255 [Comamonas testosteroni]|uniref:hypothetical protein n=1 Tax=Comamonas testosteroni TaxID=285 RepID=UPI001300C57A|nr:hypothetical protein [Comamonas testosteroni]QQN67806.1 hypothetical protein IYN88_13255 [Comamonas testosteroni]
MQQRLQGRSIIGHSLQVENHVLLGQVGLGQTVVVQLQGISTGEFAELVDSHTDLGSDLLEEVLHFAAAGLRKIAKLVLHILEDVGHFLAAHANLLGTISQLLKASGRRSRDTRQRLNLFGSIGRFLGQVDYPLHRPCNADSRDGCSEYRANTGPCLFYALSPSLELLLHLSGLAICGALSIGHAFDKATDFGDQIDCQCAKLPCHVSSAHKDRRSKAAYRKSQKLHCLLQRQHCTARRPLPPLRKEVRERG